MPRALSARFRRAHRVVVPLAATPLLLTAASGSLCSLLLERGIDAFWLLKIHTGTFGPINRQPCCSRAAGDLPEPPQAPVSITAPMMAMITVSAKLTTPRGVLEWPPTQAQLRAR